MCVCIHQLCMVGAGNKAAQTSPHSLVLLSWPSEEIPSCPESIAPLGPLLELSPALASVYGNSIISQHTEPSWIYHGVSVKHVKQNCSLDSNGGLSVAAKFPSKPYPIRYCLLTLYTRSLAWAEPLL